ncbi:MAG: hypothetical protein M3O99_09615 [Chloroflexota bacterium]|nr:hypothetical protein [Chloroflexota bacterium]
MNLFGAKKANKYRLVPRAPGDTTPLDPTIVDALRKAGMDPARFTLVPLGAGEADALASPLFKTGARVEHAFAFETVNGALGAIERVIDDDLGARISKQDSKWIVVFDAPEDPNVAAADTHQALAKRVADLGAEERGFTHLTMSLTKKTV